MNTDQVHLAASLETARADRKAAIAAIRHTLMTGLAHNAAIAALERIDAGVPAHVLDVGFKFDGGSYYIPTVLVGFGTNDWDARDAFVRSIRERNADTKEQP